MMHQMATMGGPSFVQGLLQRVEHEADVSGPRDAPADDVCTWCEKANARGRTVTVKIKWADFQISTRSRSIGMTI